MAPFIFDENEFLLPKMAIFVWSVKYTLVSKIHTCHVTSLIKVPINFYCGGGITGPSYNFIRHVVAEISGGVHSPPPSTKHVCKMRSPYEGLI